MPTACIALIRPIKSGDFERPRLVTNRILKTINRVQHKLFAELKFIIIRLVNFEIAYFYTKTGW